MFVETFYLFQAFSYIYSAIKELIIAVSAIIESNQYTIFVNNFKLIFSKICKKQILNQINSLVKTAQSTSVIEINFANIFTDKIYAESNIFYFVQLPKKKNNKTDILDYWKKKYKTKIQTILDYYYDLFCAKLNKFNNSIEISILFVDKNNITDFKQTLYSLTVQDCKIVDNILDLLMCQDWLQKISLKTILPTVLSTFVVWKNSKLQIIIDFRKINTRLYSDIYFLLRQNTIFDALKETIIFSFVNFIKSFFQ